jgi:hypothetical protein
MRLSVTVSIVLIMATAFVIGCSSEKTQTTTHQLDLAAAAAKVRLDGQPAQVAGLTPTPPSDWNDFGPSGMRSANYTLDPVEGDTDSATCAVFYFGPQMGGDVEANIKRWLGQMVMPDGADPAQAAARQTGEVDGMPVHLVEVSGTYLAAAGGMMGGPTTPMDGYLMAAAVIEGPEGNVFIKLTGPEKTARRMHQGFLAMLGGVRRGLTM